MALSDWDPTRVARAQKINPAQYQAQTYDPQKITQAGADMQALKKAMGITDPVDFRKQMIAAGTNQINANAEGMKGASDQNYASRGNYRAAAAANAQDRINAAVSGQKLDLANTAEQSYANAVQNANMRDLQMAMGLNQQANQIGLANAGMVNQAGMYNTNAMNDAAKFNIGNQYDRDKAAIKARQDLLAGGIEAAPSVIQGLASFFGG